MKIKDPDSQVLTIPDIRNKLSPIKNLIALIEHHLPLDSSELSDLIKKEIQRSKESIKYLSGDNNNL